MQIYDTKFNNIQNPIRKSHKVDDNNINEQKGKI